MLSKEAELKVQNLIANDPNFIPFTSEDLKNRTPQSKKVLEAIAKNGDPHAVLKAVYQSYMRGDLDHKLPEPEKIEQSA